MNTEIINCFLFASPTSASESNVVTEQSCSLLRICINMPDTSTRDFQNKMFRKFHVYIDLVSRPVIGQMSGRHCSDVFTCREEQLCTTAEEFGHHENGFS